MENRMMPMPPSHWIMLRHSKMARGRASILDATVAPVVVKPETVSKYASVKV